MRATLLISLAVATVSAHPHLADRQGSIDGWAPAGPDDFRGPCPMMNTLANHGYLPHDGRNLTEANVINGLKNGLNFDPALGKIMFQQALIINPEPNATFFTLDMLNVHNILEHDASLSRSDAYFGNNHVFNETVFETTIKYWPEETLDANYLAMSKVFRQVESKAFNPTYRFTETTEAFSLGEVLAPIAAFGDLDAVTVNRTLVEYWFRNERLPSELGWTLRKDTPITLDIIERLSNAIGDAVSLITSDNSTTTTSRRRAIADLHAGMMASH
ncbi:Putative sterigmatocystin biosynthesis peroxidase stcC [Cytospora mali]|uniref:Sterigmatocystin biosynthesis peroxidase stcC n=1 Tax=Cytospora mali TaxID=578113 RepID=A0A0M4AQD6_CYTMA|nr:hypothetical protein [Valsa mali]KUI72246.1 Putative sterigmatocystin biosynthesis peroxidase stcC [Valsa mali]